MSGGSSRNISRQPGHDFWFYLPDHFVPTRTTSLNPRGGSQIPWWLFEERSIGGPNYGLASFPSPSPPRSSVRLLLIDEYNTYPTPRNHTPHNQTLFEQEPRSSQEVHNQGAITKLRRQLYSPHLSNIVKRLGSKSPTSSVKDDDDDVGKRCAVCLEDFETKQFVTVTPCNHMFHDECIVPWVKTNEKCPVCRSLVV